VAGDIDKFGLFRTAVLIVRFTTAVVVLHLIEALVWAIFYRWFCLPSREAAFYFSAGSYGTVGCSDVSLPPNWRALGPLEKHHRRVDVWDICEPYVCDNTVAHPSWSTIIAR
jgi:voltage-gated potassium channel